VQLVWIVSLFFAVVIALFAVQNTAPVTVSFLAWRVEAVAVSTLVLAAAALGALTTYLFGLSREIRGRLERRGSRSTIRDQDALIADLRTRVRELERERGLGVGSRELGSPEPAPADPVSPSGVIDSPRSESPPTPKVPEASPGERNP
jgi:lipopolysaccharide assembly protein A